MKSQTRHRYLFTLTTGIFVLLVVGAILSYGSAAYLGPQTHYVIEYVSEEEISTTSEPTATPTKPVTTNGNSKPVLDTSDVVSEPESKPEEKIQSGIVETIGNQIGQMLGTADTNTASTSKNDTLPIVIRPTQQVGLAVAANLVGLSNAALAKTLDGMVSHGVSWIRIDMDWNTVQHNSPQIETWGIYDRIIDAALARNMHVLPILLNPPSWARSEGCSGKCPPRSVDEFASFASHAVERYKDKGIHAWEIWNEPNMAGSWVPAANPDQYADLLKATYPAIKEKDSEAIIIVGGLGPIATSNGNIAMLEYLSKLYLYGAGDYFDAVAIHPYSFPATPSYEKSWNAWSQMSETNPSVRSIMIANGDEDKKIWITEYGAPTGGPGNQATAENYKTVGQPSYVSESFQADMLRDSVQLVKGYSWAGPFFWYSYKDLGTSFSTMENYFGLIRYDGTPKPAYDVLKELLIMQ